MYRILMDTPFGFVIELDGESPYQRQKPYAVFIDGKILTRGNRNVFRTFGLLPNTEYNIDITGLDSPLSFVHRTQRAGYVINVRDFGASGDGKNNDTLAVNSAIYTAPAGSVVRFPRGVYLAGSVMLKSGVDIFLEEGAELRQSPDRRDLAVIKGYQKSYDHEEAVANASWEGNPLDSYASLIYGRDVKNVRIYGSGTINGSGRESGFWNEPKVKKTAWRPRNIFLAYCKNITLAGITSRNSAAWNLHPFYSDKLKFYRLNIESDPNSPNTDGLNPESCGDVEIAGCRFHVGDDCIAIKSGKFYMSRRHFKPSENIRIRNCLMERGHGGVVIGSEISCGVKDVSVRQCLFRETDRGLRIKTRRGRGSASIVEGIRFANVEMEKVSNCFTVNMFYNCDPDGHSDYVRCKEPLPVGDETPAVKDIFVSNVMAREISGSAIFLSGLPESPIKGITVENSAFSFLPERETACPEMMDDEILIENLGIYMRNTDNVTLENNRFEGPYVTVIEERSEERKQ